MQTSTIDHRLGSELLRFLDCEDAYLSQLQQFAKQVAGQPVGKSVAREFISEITAIKDATGLRNLDRARLRTELSATLLMTPSALRLSGIDTGPELTPQLQIRRKQVLAKTVAVYASLRVVLVQLRESNMVVSAVLESILGEQTDRSRYGSDGRPIPQVSRIEGLRVA